MTDFSETRKQLAVMTGQLGLSQGVQVYVSHAGMPVLDLAVGENGLGAPMRPDAVLALYCSTKPLLALVAVMLAEQGRLDLDACVGEVLACPSPEVAQTGLRELLSHTAGLTQVQGVLANFIPAEQCLQVATSTPPPSQWRAGDAAYSEWQSWTLLAATVEAAGGTDCETLLQRSIIDPFALSDDLFPRMTDQQFTAYYDRLGVNVDLRGTTPVPMLMERTRRICTQPNYAFGSYGTARGLGRFYEALLTVRAGGRRGAITPAVLQRCINPARPRQYDHVLERECRFGLGFMTGLTDHDFGTHCAAGSWGHAGNAGMSFGFADDDHQLAVGLVWNGLTDTDTSLKYRRRLVVDAIYRDLGLAESTQSGDSTRTAAAHTSST
ncbi:MAG TPA: serine hydrolase domain-containing protein [Nitriliruptorales bacterium]